MVRIYVFVIFVVTLVVYGRIVTHEHVLDDRALIPHRKVLNTPFDMADIFFGKYWGDLRQQDTLYRPLTIWSLALNRWVNSVWGVSGDHPFVYRITSVLLQAGVSVMVFVFARWLGLSDAVSFFGGMFFAVLPIHTEAVAAAVNRSEILALGFGLGFLMLWQTRWVWAALCLFGGLLCKESAVLFLPVAVWYAVVMKTTTRLFDVRNLVYVGVVLVWWAMRSVAIGDGLQAVVMIDNPLVMASVGERVLTALAIQWKYLFLQVIPIGLSADYSYNQIPVIQSFLSGEVLLFLGVVVLGIGLSWRFWHTEPVVPFLLGIYVLLFGLTSNVFFPIGTIMGERLAYSPSLSVCVLGGWCLAILPRVWMWRLGGVLLVIYAGITWQRLGVWENAYTFYVAQVEASPQSAKAHYAVAHEVYQPAEQFEQAKAHYERAVEILPNYPDAWNNLGVLKKDHGLLAEAIADYETALKWHADHVAARVNLGQAFQTMGNAQLAIEAYERALKVDSTHAVACNNLAILYAMAGNDEAAKVLFERVLRVHPDYLPAKKNYQLFLGAISKP